MDLKSNILDRDKAFKSKTEEISSVFFPKFIKILSSMWGIENTDIKFIGIEHALLDYADACVCCVLLNGKHQLYFVIPYNLLHDTTPVSTLFSYLNQYQTLSDDNGQTELRNLIESYKNITSINLLDFNKDLDYSTLSNLHEEIKTIQ